MDSNTKTNTDIDFHNLKIISMNVRGLRNARKRRILFHSFKKEKYDVICLQECHLTSNDLHGIEKEWFHLVHLAEGSNNSKGLLTLFSKKIPSNNINLTLSSERCLISQITLNDTYLDIFNFYAPCITNEKTDFFISIKRLVNNYVSNDSSYYLLLGDFNSVLNNDLDIISGNKHSEKDVNNFNKLVNDLLLIDIWRELNPKRKEFTWSRSNPFTARRIDFILVSENLTAFCKDPGIRFLGFSDHKAVIVNIDFTSFKRGPSFYKFNTSLLKNTDCSHDIINEIERIKALDMNPHLCWEYIKASIKDIAKFHGRSVAYNTKKDKNMLNCKLDELERYLISFPEDEVAIKAYNEAKTKLELFLVTETEGARIRSGQKWVQDGEKCSKLFLNLEKQRSNANTLFVIENVNDNSKSYSTNPHEILNAIKNHFKGVYSSPITCNQQTNDSTFIDTNGANVLDENDKFLLNLELSEDEVFHALKSLNSGSAPGLDGLPGEVYKFFWKQIKEPLLASLNHSFQSGNLTESQRAGVICLHHKGKGQPREEITSWRPITLTNSDYKIIAKVLALRLNKCLFKCINPDQYAFVKGRQVADLLRELDDIVEHGKREFPESIILSVDYAKAFDSLSISAIKKALTYFELGENFGKWIDILFFNRTACVSNGGYISDCFDIERGVRQGCPISPLLFILTLELLARDIRNNKNITGIKIGPNSSPIKIKMYADDASFFLKDQFDYREVLSRIKLFSLFSGLYLNKNKSSAMYIGDPSQENQLKFGIKFVNKMKILGICFSNIHPASEIADNFEPKIVQLERLCSLWEKRYLTLIGKINILKSFGVSLFIYTMQSIGLNELYIKRIDSIMFKFIWNTKVNNRGKITEKVKREFMCKNKESGGLSMIDLTKLQDSFYLKWADKLLNESIESSWKIIPSLNLKSVGGLSVFNSTVKKGCFKGESLIKSSFWKKVLFCWLKHKEDELIIPRLDITDPIFNNTLVRFKDKPLFIECCINKSMLYIKDFLTNGEIMSFQDFNTKLNGRADTQFAYNIIYNALKKVELDIRNSLRPNENLNEKFYFKGLDIGNINRKAYYNLISNNKIIPITMNLREKFDIEENDSEVWSISLNCVSEVKLIHLQWKILHNIYPTGTLLYKMKIKENEDCVVCGERDTPSHCFVFCRMVEKIWKEAENVIFKLTNEVITLNEKIIMVGLSNDDPLKKGVKTVVNKVCLIGKFTISKFRVMNKGNILIMFERELLLRKMIN